MRCQKRRDIFIKAAGKAFTVNCGRCFACRSRKKSQAVFRMDAHRRFSDLKRCYFVTLTYADDFLPYEYIKADTRTGEILKDIKSDTPILNPNHIVNFFKRLRRYSDGEKFKYFYVGEYGDPGNTARPHWHIILHTNLDWKKIRDLISYSWSESCEKSTSKGVFRKLGKYETYRVSFGRFSVSAVTMRRIRYCAKYVVKDCNSQELVPKYARWSKNYGIDWLNSYEAKDCELVGRLYAYTQDAKPASLGRYFTHRMFDKDTYQSLVDRLVFAPANWPPDAILGDIKAMRDWSRKKQYEEDSSIAKARISTYTNILSAL